MSNYKNSQKTQLLFVNNIFKCTTLKKSWWIVKLFSRQQSRILPSVFFYQFFCFSWDPYGFKTLVWFTSQHIQVLHHKGPHSIDLGVALCVIMELGPQSALHQCPSADVVPLKWWRVGPLKGERKNTRGCYRKWPFTVGLITRTQGLHWYVSMILILLHYVYFICTWCGLSVRAKTISF